MRAFAAALATETNTFGAIPTARSDFEEMFYKPPGTHPDAPSFFTAPMAAARKAARAGQFELVEGTATWAEPSGLVGRQAYESLRDEILRQLQAALPVDLVFLGLHGAMVADGYDSCETDLVARIRAMVSNDTVIGAELDMHCQLTPALAEQSDVLVLFKENPHSDFMARAEDLVALCMRVVRGEVRPVITLHDCRTLIGGFQTYREPGRSFVDKLIAMELSGEVLSVSIVHGFQAADVPEAGVKVLVITDSDPDKGERIARTLAAEMATFINPEGVMLKPDAAIAAAVAVDGGPIVLADRWDNPGGGVPGDNTLLVEALLARPEIPSALGALWDPVAVAFCRAAGAGAVMPLRFGGKAAAGSGQPVDAVVRVRAVTESLVTPFGDGTVTMGPAAAISIGDLDVVLITKRTQTMHRETFTKLGIDLVCKKIVVVKSSNHFYADFRQIAKKVLYVDCDGPWPHDPLRVTYKKLRRPIAPLDLIA